MHRSTIFTGRFTRRRTAEPSNALFDAFESLVDLVSGLEKRESGGHWHATAQLTVQVLQPAVQWSALIPRTLITAGISCSGVLSEV